MPEAMRHTDQGYLSTFPEERLRKAASQTATIKVETADSTAGPYEPVKDSRIFVDNPVNEDGEAVIENEAEAQAVANLDIDLIGCKSCVKITATNGTIGALALGDATNCPVKESI